MKLRVYALQMPEPFFAVSKSWHYPSGAWNSVGVSFRWFEVVLERHFALGHLPTIAEDTQ